ncbi:MAG: 16S rRNA (adenine(1518)-N(6)/adenine(1519)-N(6))-dimethyltransferase RsmA [Deltaproteobacteria bacterium]|nr:16S rRNA (adenine(1518)-N(6)/adenine(1519)-N(6))-dimethyltransferase RsmA [Deltaproteobacteria bacterium]
MSGPRKRLAGLGLAPSRFRGQNFIKDKSLASHLASLILQSEQGGLEGEELKKEPKRVVEIGPGLGALTEALLEQGALVWAIEVDRGLASALRLWRPAIDGSLKVIQADVLTFNLERDLGFKPDLVCGNLPYNISTPILFWFMDQKVGLGVFTLQKEMALRLIAPPGGRDYGRLTIAAALWHEVKILTTISAASFFPRPKVESALIALTKKPLELCPNLKPQSLSKLTLAAFHARRKTIFNNLAAAYGAEKADKALKNLSLDPSLRPQTLAPKVLAALAVILEEGG